MIGGITLSYHISEHREEIITNLISNAIWYILSLFIAQILLWTPLILGILNYIKNKEFKIPVYAFVLAGISIIIMFIIMIISIVIAIKSYKRTINNRNEITTDLIFNSLDIELYFKDRENIITYLIYDCGVNKDNYNDVFKKEIIWTGSTYNHTKIVEANGQYILTDSNRTRSPHTYIINFNKTFMFGDNIHLKLETSVTDNDLSMTPVFSHMIKHQTIKFNIHLTVPQNLITNIRPTVYRDIGRSIKVPSNIRLESKNVGDLIQYSYSVDNPKLLYNYCIEWDFK